MRYVIAQSAGKKLIRQAIERTEREIAQPRSLLIGHMYNGSGGRFDEDLLRAEALKRLERLRELLT